MNQTVLLACLSGACGVGAVVLWKVCKDKGPAGLAALFFVVFAVFAAVHYQTAVLWQTAIPVHLQKGTDPTISCRGNVEIKFIDPTGDQQGRLLKIVNMSAHPATLATASAQREVIPPHSTRPFIVLPN